MFSRVAVQRNIARTSSQPVDFFFILVIWDGKVFKFSYGKKKYSLLLAPLKVVILKWLIPAADSGESDIFRGIFSGIGHRSIIFKKYIKK